MSSINLNYKQLSSGILLVVLVMSLLSVMPVFMVKRAAAADDEPLFKLVALCPNYSPPRRQWAQIIMNSYQNAGIDATVVFLPYSDMNARIWGAPSELHGKLFAEGGYDAYFLGHMWGKPFISPLLMWMGYPNTDYFPPNSYSVLYWDSAEQRKLNVILDTWMSTTDSNVRDKAFNDWQKIVYDAEIIMPIMYPLEVQVSNPEVKNIIAPVMPNIGGFEHLYGKTKVVYASSADWLTLNGAYSPGIHDALLIHTTTENLSTFKYTDTVLTANYENRLATSITANADATIWTVKLRENVKFHDGHVMDADDLVYSLYYVGHPSSGSDKSGQSKGYFGANPEFVWLNGTTTTLTDGAKDGGTITAVDSSTVTMACVSSCSTLVPEHTTSPFAGFVYPKHVYEQFEIASLASNTLNTGIGSITLADGTTWSGPMGTGPYKFVSYDVSTKTVTFEKFEDYWNKAALEAAGEFVVEEWQFVQIKEKEPALAALKSGTVDILGYYYQPQKEWAEGVFGNEWSEVQTWAALGYQVIGFNMQHPVWGTGVDTPVGKADSSKAEEAAQNVRLALSHLIPRRLIIDSILGGAGVPGTVPHAPSMIGFDDSLPVREYDPELAKQYLAAAGYDVGAVAAIKVETIDIKATTVDAAISSISELNIPAGSKTVKIPSFFLGMSLGLTGTSASPGTGDVYADRLVIVQSSNDGGKTWKNVGQTETDSNGEYYTTVTPASTGQYWYRLFHTPITLAQWGPGVVPVGASGQEVLLTAGFVGVPTYSEVIKVQVKTLDSQLSLPFVQINQLEAVAQSVSGQVQSLADETSSGFSSVDASIQDLAGQVTSQINSVASQVDSSSAASSAANSAQDADIAELQAALGTATTISYVAIILAILLGIVSIVMVKKK